MSDEDHHTPSEAGNSAPETTASLLAKVKEGSEEACDRLFAQYRPVLKRWAHGRLPMQLRGAIDTDDLVQNSLFRALKHMGTFAPQHEGSFLAYLRRIVVNQIRDELRRASRLEVVPETREAIPDSADGPLDQLIQAEFLEDYDGALKKLPEKQKNALILRFEFGFEFSRIADAIGSPSENAARMFVNRALTRLLKVMKEESGK